MTAAVSVRRFDLGRVDREAVAPFAGLLVVLLVAAVIAPDFYRASNLTTVGRQVAILAVIAIGQTIVLIAGAIDLSVGAVMAFAMVLASATATTSGCSLPLPSVWGSVRGSGCSTPAWSWAVACRRSSPRWRR
jgi:ribose/xylose/arabinose/galactoside ABC-type transport system permease subunit